MLAQENPAIDEAVGQVYQITRDEMLRQRMEAREEYNRIERTNQRLLEKLTAENAVLKTEKTTTLERVTKNLMKDDPTLTAEEAEKKARMLLE